MNFPNREEILNYLINVHAYSEQDIGNDTRDDLIDLVEDLLCVEELFDYVGAA